MSKTSYFILFLTLLISCSSSSKLQKPKIKSEISIEKLNKKGIVSIHTSYKKNYYTTAPYFFYNENSGFNKIQGDFYNVKHNTASNINIMIGFWSKYGNYKNSLIVLVAMTSSSTASIKNMDISVKSSKNGIFKQEKLLYSKYNIPQQRSLFIKRLELKNKYDVLNKFHDDVITVKIGEQTYTFLNPEIDLH